MEHRCFFITLALMWLLLNISSRSCSNASTFLNRDQRNNNRDEPERQKTHHKTSPVTIRNGQLSIPLQVFNINKLPKDEDSISKVVIILDENDGLSNSNRNDELVLRTQLNGFDGFLNSLYSLFRKSGKLNGRLLKDSSDEAVSDKEKIFSEWFEQQQQALSTDLGINNIQNKTEHLKENISIITDKYGEFLSKDGKFRYYNGDDSNNRYLKLVPIMIYNGKHVHTIISVQKNKQLETGVYLTAIAVSDDATSQFLGQVPIANLFLPNLIPPITPIVSASQTSFISSNNTSLCDLINMLYKVIPKKGMEVDVDFRIIGGSPATSSGAPINNKGR